MVEFACPLCCNETFNSAASLKCHILDILENLLCSFCNEKFMKIGDFINHLEYCGNVLINTEETDEPNIAKDENLDESILAKTLLKGSSHTKTEVENEDSQYFCQSCDLHFNDIDNHLTEFHKGQEIILEEEEVSLKTEVGADDQEYVLVVNSINHIDQAEFISVAPSKESTTISQQDIKDKDGRTYRQKFVKIGKFWLEQNQSKPPDKPLQAKKCPTCKTYFPITINHECDLESPKKNCNICNTTFSSFKSLKLHQRMHDPVKTQELETPANNEEGEEDGRQMFVCNVCHKTYDKEYEEIHMSSHDCNNGFNCEICNRKFFTKTNLDMHMKAHTNNKKFTCSYCKKPFVTYDSLEEHLTNQCQKRPYACQYCGRRFTRPHEKVKHERIHTGEKPHVCDICGKAFRVSYCLTLHLRTHSGSRPYQCNTCGKRFKSHSVYNHHLLTHSDVRAYKCPYCPKAFKTSVQLAGHKNSHIKPFTCPECNRPFASLYAVRAHMETHKRDNNLKYECWVCGALYSRVFALKDHVNQQHRKEGEKAKTEIVGVEDMAAASSILVNEDNILGLEGATSIEIIENEGE